MRIICLQSGSAGNCLYVESGNTAILLDAGISARQLKLRLEDHGGLLSKVQAVIISHGHRDHVGHAGVYHRRLKLPIFAPRACAQWLEMREDFSPQAYAPGAVLHFDGLTVETLATPHDARDSVAFIVSNRCVRLGVFTDLGSPFAALERALESVDAVIIESNYDPQLLASGPYPPELQERIRGPAGHLSNAEAAELVKKHRRQFRWVCLAHLSQHNNTPDVAVRTFRRIVGPSTPHLAEYYSAISLPPLE